MELVAFNRGKAAGKAEAERDAKERARREVATEGERAAAREFLRDMEFDALAGARACANAVDHAAKQIRAIRIVCWGAFWTAFLAVAPTMYFLMENFGWNFKSLGFWAVLIPWGLGLWMSGNHTYNALERLTASQKEWARKSIEYTSVADEAKRERVVALLTATKPEIQSITEHTSGAKGSVDCNLQLPVDGLMQARKEIR